jgi:flagellar basal-body rod protein FlgB
MPWKIFHDDLTQVLEQDLTWRSRRHEVIAGNVANLDTPNYTRKDIRFREILNAYLPGGSGARLTATHANHIFPDGRQSAAVRDTGEEVDIDQEMMEMAVNQLSYQASATMLGKKLDSLRTVIEGDRR